MTKEKFGGRKCSDENPLRASVPEVSVWFSWSPGPSVSRFPLGEGEGEGEAGQMGLGYMIGRDGGRQEGMIG